jgi:hypothetical protein
MSHVRIQELAYEDEELARLAFPRDTLRITHGIGSGLTRRACDAEHVVWAVGDRGPNLKPPLAIERYGLDHLSAHADTPGAKLMPAPRSARRSSSSTSVATS